MTKEELENRKLERRAKEWVIKDKGGSIIKSLVNLIKEFTEPREKQIADLEAQIEKMKCCSMCKHYSMNFLPYWCTKNNTASHCTSKCDKWEIKEK